MTDSLRAKLVYVCKDVCRLVLSEDEVNDYPYAVYDMTTTALSDKDGVYAYSGDTKIRVVSDSKSEADTTATAIQGVISSSMRDSSFFSQLMDVTKECVEGIWTIEMNYTLKQYADWVEPVEQTNTNTE